MRARVARLALALAMMVAGCAGVASAQVVDRNEAARQALRDGQYARAVVLTQQIAASEPESAMNWYRLAIAAVRTGQASLASDALANATRLDPELKFASSRERVEKLHSEIRGLQAAAASASAAAPAVVDPDPAAVGTALGQQLGGLQQHLDKRFEGVSSEIAAMRAKQEAAAQGSAAERTAWVVGFVVAVLVAAGMVALILDRAARARRENDLRDLAALPLPQLIAAARDTSSLLLERLQMHGHTQSDLYVQIGRAMPALEREAGRAQTRLSQVTSGQALAGVAHEMLPAAKILGRTSGEDVHSTVLHAQLASRGVAAVASHSAQSPAKGRAVG